MESTLINKLNKNYFERDRKKSKIIFCFVMFFLVALLFLRNLFLVDFPIWFFLILCGIIAIFCDKEEIYALIVSFVPLAQAFQIYYAIYIVLIIYLLRFLNIHKLKPTVITIVLLGIYELLHAFIGEFSIYEFIRLFAPFVLIGVLFCLNDDIVEFKVIVKTLVYITIIVLVLILLVQMKSQGLSLSELLNEGNRFGKTNNEALDSMRLNYDENGLGTIINSTVMLFLLSSIFLKTKFYDWIAFLVLLFFGILTQSRTTLICFIIDIIAFIIFVNYPAKKKIKLCGLVLLILLVLFLVFKFAFPGTLDSFIERFEVEDIANGRIDIFATYNAVLFSSLSMLLFGMGEQNISQKMNYIYNIEVNAPHNGMQQILIAWGIIGLILFILFLCAIFIGSKEKRKRKFIYFLYFLPFFISSLAGQILTNISSIMNLFNLFIFLKFVSQDNFTEDKNNE